MTDGVTISCPTCQILMPVPARILYENTEKQTIVVTLDYREVRGHFSRCQGEPTPPVAEPVRFVHGGKRACTGCGATSGECYRILHTSAKGGPDAAGPKTRGCCAMCAQGDTHPVPQGDVSCAAWGAAQEAKDDAQD